MIIATITPNCYSMPFDCVKCWLDLPPLYDYYAVEGPSLPDNRNRVMDYAYTQEDSVLFIDSDIVFSKEDVNNICLHLAQYDAITGVYCLGRPPYPAAIFKRVEGDYELAKPKRGVHEIGACGAGFLGISKKVVQEIGKNPFSNIWEGNIQHGEDISFCHRLHEKGFKLMCDSSISVGQVRTVHKYY